MFVSMLHTGAHAQVADVNGHITSSNWLVLGPFKQAVGCGGTNSELLFNYIAPSALPCEYPQAGDEITYDAIEAESISYDGPVSDFFSPFWRPFDDTVDDSHINLLEDTRNTCRSAQDEACNNLVSFLVTYVEVTGDSPADALLCLNSEDGRQVWIDNELVFNQAGCTELGICQNLVPVTITPGAHRVAVAVFGGGELEWELQFGLRTPEGDPIVNDTPGWVLHGISKPVLPQIDCPELVTPVTMLSCVVSGSGAVDVRWENPPDDSSTQTIRVLVDGAEVTTVDGASTAVGLPPETFPNLGEFEICVVNESGIPACCDVELLAPVKIRACRKNAAGGVDLEWENPPTARPEQTITVTVNGTQIAMLPGTAADTTIAAAALPEDAPEICVVNARGIPACCFPQATDASGRIAGRNWLVLGPFQGTILCDGRDRDAELLENFIAPAEIACQYPQAGDEIEYRAGQAASTGYVGPVGGSGFPIWRAFDDGTAGDGDNDLTADRELESNADVTGLLSWAVSYVEYRGASPAEVELCIGVGDSGQVWFNDVMVFSKYTCGLRQDCEYRAPMTVVPGRHRIAIAAFNADGSWGLSLGLRQGGAAITDDPNVWPDWIFHGVERGSGDYPCATGNPELCDNDVDDDGDLNVDCEDADCAQDAACAGTQFQRGDANADGGLNLADAIFVLNYLFASGAKPPCLKSADSNDDGSVDVSAPVYLLNWLFSGGPEPGPPLGECGLDPTDDELTCESFAPCA